jgi:hypothetical protein
MEASLPPLILPIKLERSEISRTSLDRQTVVKMTTRG